MPINVGYQTLGAGAPIDLYSMYANVQAQKKQQQLANFNAVANAMAQVADYQQKQKENEMAKQKMAVDLYTKLLPTTYSYPDPASPGGMKTITMSSASPETQAGLQASINSILGIQQSPTNAISPKAMATQPQGLNIPTGIPANTIPTANPTQRTMMGLPTTEGGFAGIGQNNIKIDEYGNMFDLQGNKVGETTPQGRSQFRPFSLPTPAQQQPVQQQPTQPQPTQTTLPTQEPQSAFPPGIMGIQTGKGGTKFIKSAAAGSAGATPQEDIVASVKGAFDGTVPPERLASWRDVTRVNAEIKRQSEKNGQSFPDLMLEWDATKKFVQNAQSTQQIRLRQAIDFAQNSTKNLKKLSEDFKRSNFPILNKAQLILAMNGAYGQDAATKATVFNQQLTDIVADLGNVYMGGNSPTDEGLRLAQQNLKSNWSINQLNAAIDNVDKLLTFRSNSIKTAAPMYGGQFGTKYYPQPQVTERPSYNPKTQKQGGKTITLPSGKTINLGG